MGVSEDDLAEILLYCRALVDGAGQLEAAGGDRAAVIVAALGAWRGPHARTFRARCDAEADELVAVVRGLRVEAAAWARVWADTVNEANRSRWQARVEDVIRARWSPDRLADVPLGVSDEVHPFVPVAVPSADNGFRATGGLERW